MNGSAGLACVLDHVVALLAFSADQACGLCVITIDAVWDEIHAVLATVFVARQLHLRLAAQRAVSSPVFVILHIVGIGALVAADMVGDIGLVNLVLVIVLEEGVAGRALV